HRRGGDRDAAVDHGPPAPRRARPDGGQPARAAARQAARRDDADRARDATGRAPVHRAAGLRANPLSGLARSRYMRRRIVGALAVLGAVGGAAIALAASLVPAARPATPEPW